MSSITLPKLIRDLRYAKGWGPDELCSRITFHALSSIRSSAALPGHPQAGTLKKICHALGVPPEAMLAPPPISLNSVRVLPLHTEPATMSSRELPVRVRSPEARTS